MSEGQHAAAKARTKTVRQRTKGAIAQEQVKCCCLKVSLRILICSPLAVQVALLAPFAAPSCKQRCLLSAHASFAGSRPRQFPGGDGGVPPFPTRVTLLLAAVKLWMFMDHDRTEATRGHSGRRAWANSSRCRTSVKCAALAAGEYLFHRVVTLSRVARQSSRVSDACARVSRCRLTVVH